MRIGLLQDLDARGAAAVIPPKANCKIQRSYDTEVYKWRHLGANYFAKIKKFRGIATRYDKTDCSYTSLLEPCSHSHRLKVIVHGIARDHVHMLLSIPWKHLLSDVMQRIKGRSSRQIQMEFPELRKRYWGQRFWARGYFSSTSGNVTEDIIMEYLELHS